MKFESINTEKCVIIYAAISPNITHIHGTYAKRKATTY